MSMMILDAELEARLRAQRRMWGADKFDEVWGGVYMMAPLLNDEHQEIVARLIRVFEEVLGDAGLARVRAGVNLAGLDADDWTLDFRVPDVAVFLRDTAAENCDTHWRGPADFLIEVTSPGDRTREKLSFYANLGVKEVLLVERAGWSLELFRHDGAELKPVGVSSLDAPGVVRSGTVPFTFELLDGDKRPAVRVTHVESARRWNV
ncbi:MAG TPA: hypothetical protein DCM87_04535 [Planctomycetes bacterium]|nr:hypothetical protein [Planctomycetota bacterium]